LEIICVVVSIFECDGSKSKIFLTQWKEIQRAFGKEWNADSMTIIFC